MRQKMSKMSKTYPLFEYKTRTLIGWTLIEKLKKVNLPTCQMSRNNVINHWISSLAMAQDSVLAQVWVSRGKTSRTESFRPASFSREGDSIDMTGDSLRPFIMISANSCHHILSCAGPTHRQLQILWRRGGRHLFRWGFRLFERRWWQRRRRSFWDHRSRANRGDNTVLHSGWSVWCGDLQGTKSFVFVTLFNEQDAHIGELWFNLFLFVLHCRTLYYWPSQPYCATVSHGAAP